MVYTIPGSGYDMTGPHTMLIVARIIATSEAVWLSFIEHETSGGAGAATLGRKNNGNLYWAQGTTNGDAIAAGDADNWCVFAVTDTEGTGDVRFHKCVFGGANTHTTTASGALIDSPSVHGGTMRIGGNDDFANIRVAAVANWAGTTLSDVQIDGIKTAATSQSIADLLPTNLYDDSDAFATNLVNPGVMNRTSIVGTTDNADDPAGWVYGLGGAASTSFPPLQSFRTRSPLYSR